MPNSVEIELVTPQEGYKLMDDWLESVFFSPENTGDEFPDLDPEDDDEPEDEV